MRKDIAIRTRKELQRRIRNNLWINEEGTSKESKKRCSNIIKIDRIINGYALVGHYGMVSKVQYKI